MKLELLLNKLAKHERIRSLIAETTNLSTDKLVDSLLKEFEQVAERYKSLSDFAGQARMLADATLKGERELAPVPNRPSPVSRAKSAETRPSPSPSQQLRIAPIKIGLPPIDVSETERAMATKREEEAKKERLRKELESVERLIVADIEQEWEDKADKIQTRITRLKNSEQLLRNQLSAVEARQPEEERVAEPEVVPPEVPEIGDHDVLYVHGVCRPGAIAGGLPDVIHDIGGIEENSRLLGVVVGKLRWIVSVLHREELVVTKSGMLLLKREEALRLRSAHERILNIFRQREPVVPFEFGAIARGVGELAEKAAIVSRSLDAALKAEEQATEVSLRLFALDAIIRPAIMNRQPGGDVQDRVREQRKTAKRSDIKLLERLLQYERSFAEKVHAKLSAACSAASIHSLVNLGSGTVEEWKIILHASYSVGVEGRAQFLAAVREVEEENTAGILLEVRTSEARFSFVAESAAVQAASA